MTVLLVVATFVVILTLDYFWSRRAAHASASPEAAPAGAPARASGASVASGFLVPDHLRFHPGHTWALGESPRLVRVGLDDFAARLAGPADEWVLPKRGTWIRQGQKLLTLRRQGKEAAMLSPVEGIVSEVNNALDADPSIVSRDPYGAGWIVTIEAPDLATSFRNLLSGWVARSWMEESAARLRRMMPQPAGPTALDGGTAMPELGAAIPEEAWSDLTREFFLG